MGAFGLYTHIQSNNVRSAILLAGFPVLLIGLVYALTLVLIGMGFLPSTGRLGGDFLLAFRMLAAGAPLAIVVSLVWFAIAYFANTRIIDVVTGARRVSRQSEPELYNLLENLCISRGIPTPRLAIIDSPALNAFASGLNDKQYTITVTRGLMQTLNREELEAVLAHELTHVMNRDVRTMVIASVFAGVITLMSQLVFRVAQFGGLARVGGRKGGNGILILIGLVALVIGGLLSVVIRMALSRSREFVADAGAVELTRNPDAMIAALRKIQSGGDKLEAPGAIQAMFLDNEPMGVMDLFATHPPIEKRIDALVKFAGGRDPGPTAIRVQEEVVPKGPWG